MAIIEFSFFPRHISACLSTPPIQSCPYLIEKVHLLSSKSKRLYNDHYYLYDLPFKKLCSIIDWMDQNEILGLLSQYNALEEDQPGQTGCVFSQDEHPIESSTKKEIAIPKVTKAKSASGDVTLLKTVLTSACERNCNYCAFRAGRDFRRATLSPDDMSRIFYQMHISGIVKGLFLSSGVAGGGVRTQDRLIDTADILRKKYDYRGYLHLKIMPGAEKDQVLRAMQLATRVSVNLEAPNPLRLKSLAPLKNFLNELMRPLRWVEEIRSTLVNSNRFDRRWPSLATQFVVGSVGESDLELLQTSEHLFKNIGLSRIYYSKFTPIRDTPFENYPAENLMRQNRLYQASFLLKSYGYTYEEFDFLQNGNLPLEIDPKLAWAQTNLRSTPVEINTAERSQLLRIPGFGPKGVKSILETRSKHPIKEPGDLKRLGINPARALDYVLLNGKRPNKQFSLW